MSYDTTYIYKCNVKDLDMEGQGSELGGLMTSGVNGSYTIEESNVNNVNINFNTTKMESYSSGTTAVGGIVAGACFNQYKIKNCNVTDLTITSNATSTGGIMGSIAGEGCEISGCKVENTNINTGNESHTGMYGSAAGIVADAGDLQNISNCTVKNVEIETSSDNMAGIIGTTFGATITFDNCNVEDLTCTDNNTVSASTRLIGGLVGKAGKINVTNSNLSKINLNVLNGKKSTVQIGGIAANATDSTSIDNVNLEGITINNNTGGTSGGMIAVQLGSILNVSNVKKFNNISITTNGEAGGIAGYSYASPSIDKITGNNVFVSAKRGAGGLIAITDTKEEMPISNITLSNLKVLGSYGTGGLVGVAVNPKLNNITLTNISVSEDSYGSTGGLVGIATKTSNLMSDQTVTSIAKFTGITINKTSNGTNKIVGGTQHTGILLGFGKIITDNININDITIDGTKSQTVGTIGQADSASDVKNITVNNVNVIAKERGGIIAGISQANITGCTVNKSTIAGTASGDFGGIVGNMPVGTTILSNCNVNESKLIATTGHLGGIIGSASNTISGCTLLNTNITGEGVNGVGGIVGHGSNFTGTDTYVKKCNVIDSNISGNSQVGGISGGATVKIENCFVGGKENETFEEGKYAVTITGNDSVGGIIGDPGVISSAGQSMITMIGTNISNSLIKGTTNADYLVGIHGRFSTTYSGTQVETITSSNYTDCKTEIK